MRKKIIVIVVIIVVIIIKLLLGIVFDNKNTPKERKETDTIDKQIDEIPPVLELNMSKLKIEQNTDINYEYFISKAKDETDGSLKDKVTYNTLDTSKTGEFIITYKVSDKAGNVTTADLAVIIYEASEDCCGYSPTDDWIEPDEEKQTNKGKPTKNKKFYIKDYKNLQEANIKAKAYGDSYGVEYQIETGNDGDDYFHVIFKDNK